MYGGKGEVVGPATGEEVSTCVDVQFPGNTDPIECYLYQLSRAAPPPLPGGYHVGDEVFFTGASCDVPERQTQDVRRQGRGRRPGHR